MKPTDDPVCIICGTRLKGSGSLKSSTCRQAICRTKFRLQSAHQAHRRSQAAAEKYRAVLTKAQRLRDATPTTRNPNEYTVIVTPSNQKKLVRMPRRRKYRFAKKLLRILEQLRPDELDSLNDTTHPVSANPESKPDMLNVIQDACSNCRGRCCSRGSDHAYLDKSTIIRFSKSNGIKNRSMLLEIYCQNLPGSSYEGSCVFHTEKGCGLSREMRSDTCNNTICAGVSELLNRAQLDGTKKFFLAATTQSDVVRFGFTELKSK